MTSINHDLNKIQKSKALKILIRNQGIPDDIRGGVWSRISNSYGKYVKNQNMLKTMIDAKSLVDNPWIEQIEKDLPRTFPNNRLFHEDGIKESLRRVLYCFTIMKPEVGYTQAMNYLAAMLLFYLREDEAFWLICTLIEDILPKNYYCNDLIGVRIDVEVFKMVFQQRLPKVEKHFQRYYVDVGLFVTQWFLCVFISLLPMNCATRFLDSLFYDGNKMLFRVALALFNINKNLILATHDTTKLLELCQSLPSTVNDPDLLMQYAFDEDTLLGFSYLEISKFRRLVAEKFNCQL
uniref:Rab-GAP TBC domain-containing protein n=1 Tax=Arcella intermedia TaxID=1963864 RepID=A0A6B2LBV5_9EUKA